MTKVGRLLCRAGLHQWEQWISVETPLIPIIGLDDLALDGLVLDSENLAIETRTRTCSRCGKGEVTNILHW